MDPLSVLRDRFAQPDAAAQVAQQYHQTVEQAARTGKGRDLYAKVAAMPDVGPPLIGSGPQGGGFDWANRASDAASEFTNDMLIPHTPLDWGLTLATGGTGKLLSTGAKIATIAGSHMLTADPAEAGGSSIIKYGEQLPQKIADAFHHFSSLRTGKPTEHMASKIEGAPSFERPLIKPEDLQGKEIIFTPGDRTLAGGTLTKVGDNELRRAIPMEGGPDYPFLHSAEPVPGYEGQRMWANKGTHSTGMVNLGNEVLKRGNEPVLMYLPMGKKALDSSKQMTMPAIDLAKQADVTDKAAAHIDDIMAAAGIKNFPGFRASYEDLTGWADRASGTSRAKLVKALDTSVAQKGGAPDIGELRYALTDARLHETPTGSPGLTVSQFDPRAGRIENSLSSTYETATGGPRGGAGTLGASVPWHIAARDMHEALMKQGNPVKFAERPDYYSTRMQKGLPRTQFADQHWVDTMSDWLRKNPQGW